MIKNLRYLLNENKISANKMTQDLNISSSSVTDWEKGKGTPSINTVLKIADYFNVSIDYLLGREQKENIDMNNSDFYRILFSDDGMKAIRIQLIPLIEQYGYERLASDIGVTILDVKQFLTTDLTLGNSCTAKLDLILSILDTNVYKLLTNESKNIKPTYCLPSTKLYDNAFSNEQSQQMIADMKKSVSVVEEDETKIL